MTDSNLQSTFHTDAADTHGAAAAPENTITGRARHECTRSSLQADIDRAEIVERWLTVAQRVTEGFAVAVVSYALFVFAGGMQ